MPTSKALLKRNPACLVALLLACGCPVSGEVTAPSSSASAGASGGAGSTGSGFGTGSSTGSNGPNGTSGAVGASNSSTGAIGGGTTTSGAAASTGSTSTGGNNSTAGGVGSSGSTGSGTNSTGGLFSGTSGGGTTGGVATSGGTSGGSTGCSTSVALTWDGPTQDTDGNCITNLGWFLVEWGQVSGGPYPNQVNVGLPCTPGAPVACDSAGGMIAPLTCSYTLTGLTNGTWYFVALSVNTQGVQSVPSGQASGTIACPCNDCACTSGSDCPPFQMCDTLNGGICDTSCTGTGCACVTDSQCAGGYEEQAGLGQGEICVGGTCVAGCNAATDCPLDLSCDLSAHTCGCTGSNCACVIDTQCNADDEQVESVCGTNGLCVSGCKTGYNCTSSTACDQSQGFISTCENPCTSGACSCIFDSQCTDGGVGLGIACLENSGQCGSGCATGYDCATNLGCETSTNTCISNCATSGDPSECACISDSQCNAGLTGQGVICNNALCFPGCHSNADCDGGNCDLTSTPGTCQ
jgi:hypothetical protein